MENLNQVDVSDNQFSDSQVSGALLDEAAVYDGAAILSNNVYKTNLKGNTFQDLSAKIRGGAVVIKEGNSTYFGESLTNSRDGPRCVIEDNNFQRCSAQQGGAIYLENTRSLSFAGSNNFDQNKAIRYNQIPIFASVNSFSGSNEQLGQGSALFTSCDTDVRCIIKVDEGTLFNNNQIINASTGEALPADQAPSIYAVGEKPSVPESTG